MCNEIVGVGRHRAGHGGADCVGDGLGAAGWTVWVTARSARGRGTGHLPGTIEETAEAVTSAGGGEASRLPAIIPTTIRSGHSVIAPPAITPGCICW